MLFSIIIMLLAALRSCNGSPSFIEEYSQNNYMPQVYNAWYGPQVIAPDSPYVAVAGVDKLYFIDTGFDSETAQHIKNQIESATMPGQTYVFIDHIAATAELRDSVTNQTIFVFDPPYARVLFATSMNKFNPELQLPVHEPAGNWLKSYDIGIRLTKRDVCADFGCSSNEECVDQNYGCTTCMMYRVDNECSGSIVNAIGMCRPACDRAVDTARDDGETDADYYQRMDSLHWS